MVKSKNLTITTDFYLTFSRTGYRPNIEQGRLTFQKGGRNQSKGLSSESHPSLNSACDHVSTPKLLTLIIDMNIDMNVTGSALRFSATVGAVLRRKH